MTDPKVTDIQELLPFWLNGSLDSEERLRVEAALAEDAALREEAEMLRAMRRSLKETHDTHTGPGEFGLARLHRALDAERATTAQVLVSRRPVFWALGSAFAASLATVLVLGTGPSQAPAPVYEQASGEPAAVVVSFSPNASVAEISELVRENGLTIIDGPSALGLFRLLPLPGEVPSLAEIAAQLEEDERVLRVDIEE